MLEAKLANKEFNLWFEKNFTEEMKKDCKDIKEILRTSFILGFEKGKECRK